MAAATPQTIERSATAQGDGTTDYYVNGRSWPYFTVQYDTTNGAAGTNTLTLWASNRDDGTAPADLAAADWTDITNAWTGAASYVADAFAVASVLRAFRWLRVRIIRAADGGAADGAWTIRVRQTQ